jgi:hypothetical protein
MAPTAMPPTPTIPTLDAGPKIPMMRACGLVGRRYQWMWARVSSGEIRAEKIDGRWFVDLPSVFAAHSHPTRAGRPARTAAER